MRLGRRSAQPPAEPYQIEPEDAGGMGVRPGFKIGDKEKTTETKDAAAEKAGRRKLIIGLAVGIVAVLLLLLILSPSGKGGVLMTQADQDMLRSYKDYLIKYNQHPRGEDIETRLKRVERHLKAYRWSLSVGEKEGAQKEFDALLFMDNDRNSPLYKYCVEKLKRRA
jgi:hypothetical protein